jgi:sugar lactone lactonase YvrE
MLTHRLCKSFALAVMLSFFSAAPVCADILYVSNFYDDFGAWITKVDSDGVRSTFVASRPGNGPIGLAFDRAGNLYASFITTNTIEKYTREGIGSVFASSGLNSPQGLAFDSAGNLYAANSGNNTIEKFTSTGVGSVFASSGLNAPNGLAFDRADNLFASNFNTNTIEKFAPSGTRSIFANTQFSGLVGLAFDNAGNLYVGGTNGSIDKFTLGGGRSLFASVVINPIKINHSLHDLAFDSSGYLYAADGPTTDAVDKFTSSGAGSFFVTTGLAGPWALAFTDDAGVPLPLANIPEPSTLAMLAIGIPALLGLRRRRVPWLNQF